MLRVCTRVCTPRRLLGVLWLPLSMLTVSGVGGENREADGMTYVQHRDKEAQESGEIGYG